MKARAGFSITIAFCACLQGPVAWAQATVAGKKPAPVKKAVPAKKAAPVISEKSFMDALNDRIGKIWKPPETSEALTARVLIKINDRGELDGTELTQSSGRDDVDETALKAVKDAAPFGPMPQAFKDGLNLTYTFKTNASKQTDFSPYISSLREKVNGGWRSPRVASPCQVTLKFTLDASGALKDISIKKSSGLKAVDDAGIQAIRRGAPYGPLPEGEENLGMEYTLSAAPEDSPVRQYQFNNKPISEGGWQVTRSGATLKPLEVDTKINRQLKDREYALQDRIAALKASVDRETDRNRRVDLLIDLSACLKDLHDFDGASAMLEDALAVEAQENPGSPRYARALCQLAGTCSAAGKPERSEELYEKALPLLREHLKDDARELSKVLEDYAKFLYKNKKTERANQLYAEVRKLKG